MKLYEALEKQLKKENNFLTDNGELKKWVVINKAQNFDAGLIELLFENKELKEKFFLDIKGIFVFNQNLFVQFLEQKNYLNDSYTQYKNKVGLTIDGKYLKQRNEVALVWPFKDCVLEGGQSKEEDKRDEIFFNEILAQDEIAQLLEPKVITNSITFTKNGKQNFKGFTRDAEINRRRGLEEDTITDNLIIKGNNLLALHSLKKVFAEKVKLIYIDPPYNTGGDSFKYNDSFNHSSWLTFMMNRIKVAKDLLSRDGSIIIQLDFNEVHYCKVLMDSIFGRENFRNEVIWHYEKWTAGSNSLQKNHDNLLIYSKTANYKFNELKEVTDNLKEKYKKGYLIGGGGGSEGLVVYDKKNPEAIKKINSGKYKVVYSDMEGKPLSNVWKLPFINPVAKERTGFNSQKPEKLLQRIIEMSTDENDIVLDFHVGSGTTSAVSHKLNRQYIGIEQMDYIQELTLKRLNNVIDGEQGGISKSVNWKGGGSFNYFELKKYNQSFIEQIEDAKDNKMILSIWDKMKTKSFLNYNLDLQKQDEHIEEFKNLELAQQKQHLIELLDKNQLYVNLSSINDKDFAVSKEEKEVTNDFYQLKKD